jgi:hypothetical protein
MSKVGARGIASGVAAVLPVLGLALGSVALMNLDVGWAHGGASHYGVKYVAAFTDDDGHVDSNSKDPHDGGTDPGYSNNVATCYAHVIKFDKVQVTISNAYPGYSCTIWSRIQNVGNKSLKYKTPTITSPSVLTVSSSLASACNVLKPSSKVYQQTVVHVEQSANQNATYQFVIEAGFEETGHRCK